MAKKLSPTIILAIAATLLFASVSLAGSEPMQVRLSHIFPPDSFKSCVHAAAEVFKAELEERSGGRFEVTIYGAGILGKEIDTLEATKNGVIEMNCVPMVGLSRAYLPTVIFFSPYLFKNRDVALEVLYGPFGKKILNNITKNAGVTALDFIAGDTYMAITNNKRPIKTPEDIKGLKMRVMDQMGIAMFKAFGASAVTISYSELFTSLQTGVVDGQTNPPELVQNGKFYEVQKYMTLAKSQYGYQVLICNTKWLEGLSPEDRKLVMDSWNNAKYTLFGLGLILQLKAIANLSNHMKVNTIPPQDIPKFAKIGRPAGLEFMRQKAGDQLVDELLQAIDAAEKKLGYQ